MLFFIDKEEKKMSILDVLEELVMNLAGNQASAYWWGEEEMPQCMKDRLEKEGGN